MGEQESIDIVKWIVSALMLILLLNAILFLFNTLYVSYNKQASKWSQAIGTAAEERMTDMDKEEVPVTSVCNALMEFPTGSLVFVSVHVAGDSNVTVFADDSYINTSDNSAFATVFSEAVDGVSLVDGMTMLTNGHDGSKLGTDYITTAANYLLHNYSAYKCIVQRVEVNVSGGTFSRSNGSFVAYDVTILRR